MAAAKIDGTAIARKVREGLRAEIAEKKALNPRFQPCLKIIQGAFAAAPSRFLSRTKLTTKLAAVGDRSDSCKLQPHLIAPRPDTDIRDALQPPMCA